MLPSAIPGATIPQLRSFCETARLLSIVGAAKSLKLAHPTVWKQVRALEETLGVALIETHRRGCRPTAAGSALLLLAQPIIEGLDSLESEFRHAMDTQSTTITIAASPRTVAEELPGFLQGFANRHPGIRIQLHEVTDIAIPTYIMERKADLGLSGLAGRSGEMDSALNLELIYALELRLLAPEHHPVARRQKVQTEDLAAWPLLNAIDLFPSDSVKARLRELRCHEHPEKRFELTSAGTLRRYVSLGLGIGIVGTLPGQEPGPGLHEAPLTHLLGLLEVHAVYRRSHTLGTAARLLIDEMRDELGEPKPAMPRRRR
jgi:molybdate transport repressor ModE-like protein